MRIRRAWPVVLFLVAVAVGSRVCNRRPLPPNLDESRYNTDYDANEQEGDEPRGDNLGPPSLENLPSWKLIFHIWGPGVIGAFIGFWFGYRLAGNNDVGLLRLVNLLVGPCAVLIGTTIVAITFAGNWKMTAHQAQLRKNLIYISWFLSCFAVLAILIAAVYAALANMSENSTDLSASDMNFWEDIKFWGAGATMMLSASVFGFISLTYKIIDLVVQHTKDQSQPGPPVPQLADGGGVCAQGSDA